MSLFQSAKAGLFKGTNNNNFTNLTNQAPTNIHPNAPSASDLNQLNAQNPAPQQTGLLFSSGAGTAAQQQIPTQQSSGSLFGAAPQSSFGGGFGSGGGGSIFGNSGSTVSAGTGLLMPTPPTGNGSLFSNSVQPSTGGSLFPAPSSGFGQQSGGLLSAQNQTSGGGGSLFGAPPTTPPQSLFGGPQTQVQQSGSPSMFGSVLNPSPQPSGGLFSAGAQTTVNASPGNTFGQQTIGGGLLGQANPQPSFLNPNTGLLGGPSNLTQNPTSGGSLFSNLSPQTPQPTTGGLLGVNPIPGNTFGGSGFGSTGGTGGFGGSGFGMTGGTGFGVGGFGSTQASTGFGGGLLGSTNSQAQEAPNPNAHLPGTIGQIGRSQLHEDRNRGWVLASVTGAIKDQSIEELRVRDYFAVRDNSIPEQTRTQIQTLIDTNVQNRNNRGQGSSLFPSTTPQLNAPPQLNTIPAPGLNSGSIFANNPAPILNTGLQPNQNLLPNQSQTTPPGSLFSHTNTQAATISGSLSSNQPQDKPAPSTQPTGGLFSNFTLPKELSAANPVENNAAPQPSRNSNQNRSTYPQFGITVSSQAGHFSYEMNKMLFVSSLVQSFSEYNMEFNEDLLDNTDFVPKLFEFLRKYNITPPTRNVPTFRVSGVQPQKTTGKDPVNRNSSQNDEKDIGFFKPKAAARGNNYEEETKENPNDQGRLIQVPLNNPSAAAVATKKKAAPVSDSSEESSEDKKPITAPKKPAPKAAAKKAESSSSSDSDEESPVAKRSDIPSEERPPARSGSASRSKSKSKSPSKNE